MTAMELILSRLPQTQHDNEVLMREVLQRLVRIEEALRQIQNQNTVQARGRKEEDGR